MDEVEGISRPKTSNPYIGGTPAEDSSMSISHLLLRGYVEGSIVNEPFEVVFKSLTTEQIHEVDSMVVALQGGGEHRASRNARYMKYLSRSVETVCISHKDKDSTFWDFTELDEKGKEDALKKMSAFVFNKLFAMYMQFEEQVNDLIKTVEIKKS
jgi:hypothetical protein